MATTSPRVSINASRSRAFLDVIRFLADVEDFQELNDIETLVHERISNAVIARPSYIPVKNTHALLESVSVPRELLDTINHCSIVAMARAQLDWVELSIVFGRLRVVFGSQLSRHKERLDEVYTSIAFFICAREDEPHGKDTMLWSVDIQGPAHFHEPKGAKRLIDRVFHERIFSAVDVDHYRKFMREPRSLHECPIWGALARDRLAPENHFVAFDFIFYMLDACLLAQERHPVFDGHANGSYIARNNLAFLRRQHAGRLGWHPSAERTGRLVRPDTRSPTREASPVLPPPIPKQHPSDRPRDSDNDDNRRRKFHRSSR